MSTRESLARLKLAQRSGCLQLFGACSSALILLLSVATLLNGAAAEELFRLDDREISFVLDRNLKKVGTADFALTLAGQSGLASELTYFTLSNPNRVVVDLEGGTLSKSLSRSFSSEQGIAAIRIGRYPDKVRFVLELQEGIRPQIQVSGDARKFLLQISSLQSLERSSGARFRISDRQNVQSPGIFRSRPYNSIAEYPEGMLREGTPLRFEIDRKSIVLRPLAAESLTIASLSSEPLYLSVQSAQVVQPGTEQETAVLSEALQIVPTDLTIEAGASAAIKVSVVDTSRESEQHFRINILPRLNSMEQVSAGQRSEKIAIGAGLSVPVYVPPLRPASRITWKRTDSVIALKNDGNCSVLFEDGSVCDESDKCRPFGNFRIFPGNTFGIELPGKYRVEMVKNVYGKRSSFAVNSISE